MPQVTDTMKILWLSKGFEGYLPGIRDGLSKALALSGDLRACVPKISLEKAPRDPKTGNLVMDALKGSHILLPGIGGLTEDHIHAAGDTLSLVFQPSAGFEGIDLATCEKYGIPVCNCPGSNALQAAETALMLMLLSLRNIPACMENVSSRVVGAPNGSDLTRTTVCLVGFGNIGSQVGRMLETAFKCKILSVNSKSPREQLLEYLAIADIVSLHCPLKEDTEGLISTEELKLMKETAVLINTARGKVVDKQALMKALDNREIGFYAADVFWSEPADPKDEIFGMKNVFFTPHIGASTKEHQYHLGQLLANAIQAVIVNKNPDALANRLA